MCFEHPADHGPRQQVQTAGDRIRERQRAVGLDGLAATVSLRHPLTRVGEAHGNLEPHQRDPVAADRVIRLTDADRHRQTQLVDLRFMALVIKTQTGRDRSQKRIVVLGARRVCGLQHLSQREFEDVVMPGQMALGHHRRQRVGHRRDKARDRLPGRHSLSDGFPRVAHRVRRVSDRRGEMPFGEVEQL